MKRFIVAVATNYFSVDRGEESVTRFYTTHAATKETAAKRIMVDVAAGDKVWSENNAELRYSTLIFAETLTKRKIKAIDSGFTGVVTARIHARSDLTYGKITLEQYEAIDKMDDTFRAILDAIEH